MPAFSTPQLLKLVGLLCEYFNILYCNSVLKKLVKLALNKLLKANDFDVFIDKENPLGTVKQRIREGMVDCYDNDLYYFCVDLDYRAPMHFSIR